jgi:hypothetical protein
MAESLLLSLLKVSKGELAPEAKEILLSVLYDHWSRDEQVEEAWLEALQSTNPQALLTEIRALLTQPLLDTAKALGQAATKPRP